MYIVKWNGPRHSWTLNWFTGVGACPWTNDKKDAKLFHTEEEARAAVLAKSREWHDISVIEYIHPLNIR